MLYGKDDRQLSRQYEKHVGAGGKLRLMQLRNCHIDRLTASSA
jgi:hypothetical protein